MPTSATSCLVSSGVPRLGRRRALPFQGCHLDPDPRLRYPSRPSPVRAGSRPSGRATHRRHQRLRPLFRRRRADWNGTRSRSRAARRTITLGTGPSPAGHGRARHARAGGFRRVDCPGDLVARVYRSDGSFDAPVRASASKDPRFAADLTRRPLLSGHRFNRIDAPEPIP
jgi:hypothetical protein